MPHDYTGVGGPPPMFAPTLRTPADCARLAAVTPQPSEEMVRNVVQAVCDGVMSAQSATEVIFVLFDKGK